MERKLETLKQEIEFKIDRLSILLKNHDDLLSKHEKALFGDGGGGMLGVIVKHQYLDNTLRIFWWVLGTIGTAAIFAAVNLTAGYLRK